MGLGDGAAAFLSTQLRLTRIVEVDVAIVAHRHILHLKLIDMKVEHGEIADGTLRLPSHRGEHDVAGIITEAYHRELLRADDHAKGLTPIDAYHQFRHIRVVDPVDPGLHIEDGRIGKMTNSLL